MDFTLVGTAVHLYFCRAVESAENADQPNTEYAPALAAE